MKISRKGAVLALATAAALALSSCAANEGGAAPGRSTESGASLSGTLTGDRRVLGRPPPRRPGSPRSRPSTPASPSTTPPTARGPVASFRRRRRRLRRIRPGLKPEEMTAERWPSRAATPAKRDQPAGLHLPDRRDLQPRGRHRPQAGRRRRWPASSPARSPSGTTRRSPATTTGVELPDTEHHRRAPRRRLGHHRELHRLPAHAAPEVWTAEPDGEWPLEGGEAAPQTSGVVDTVTNGSGTIGYADASRPATSAWPRSRSATSYLKSTAEAAARPRRCLPAGRGRRRAAERPGHRARPQGRAATSTRSSWCPTRSPARSTRTRQIADLVKAYLSYIGSADGQQAAAEGRQCSAVVGAVRPTSRPRPRRSPEVLVAHRCHGPAPRALTTIGFRTITDRDPERA